MIAGTIDTGPLTIGVSTIGVAPLRKRWPVSLQCVRWVGDHISRIGSHIGRVQILNLFPSLFTLWHFAISYAVAASCWQRCGEGGEGANHLLTFHLLACWCKSSTVLFIYVHFIYSTGSFQLLACWCKSSTVLSYYAFISSTRLGHFIYSSTGCLRIARGNRKREMKEGGREWKGR